MGSRLFIKTQKMKLGLFGWIAIFILILILAKGFSFSGLFSNLF